MDDTSPASSLAKNLLRLARSGWKVTIQPVPNPFGVPIRADLLFLRQRDPADPKPEIEPYPVVLSIDLFDAGEIELSIQHFCDMFLSKQSP